MLYQNLLSRISSRTDRSRTVISICVLFAIILGVGAIWSLKRSNQPTVPVSPSPPESVTYTLKIDKLGLTIPIVLNVDGSNEVAYLKALESGVAHYEGTAVPGKVGNSFIFGHSDYYKNKPGNFKQIFKKLDKLKTGDSIVIRKNDDNLGYIVVESKIIKDTDFSVLEPTSEEILTIMTCWPPGTIEKRYVVRAKRTTPTVSPSALGKH